MCAGDTLPLWAAQCVEHLVASGHAEPALLIRDATPPARRRRTARTALYDLYNDRYVMRRCPALQPVEMPAPLRSVPSLSCRVETKGKWSQYFSAEDVDAIRGHRLDFILRFGFNIIRGDILHAARYGVWSYHHGDERVFRGGPPGFWEMYRGEPTTGAILQRLTERLDGGVVLHRGRFATWRGSWSGGLDHFFRASSDWCARVCAEIRAGNTAVVDGAPTPSTAPILRAPSNAQFAKFAVGIARHLGAKAWNLLFHDEVWNVAVVPERLEDIVAAGKIRQAPRWCAPHRPGHFIADPFPCGPDLLVEDYDQAGKGKLSRLSPPFDSPTLKLGPAIERPEHLSYPCVFVDGDRTFCIPEAFQAQRVIFYEQVDGQWKQVHSALEGLKVVDPTLFRHGGHYWLFYSLQDDGAFGNLKLYAHYAPSLEGPWHPHLLNPLECDITASRAAGHAFTVEGRVFRPAQDCSVTYGSAVTIHEILELTPTTFSERPVARLAPDPEGEYPDGLHTVNAMGGETVIDGKRFERSWSAWRVSWRRWREILM